MRDVASPRPGTDVLDELGPPTSITTLTSIKLQYHLLFTTINAGDYEDGEAWLKLSRKRMRYARDRLGYSLVMVSEEAGVAEGTAIRAEHEEEIRPGTARKIAGALGVRVADLMKEETE